MQQKIKFFSFFFVFLTNCVSQEKESFINIVTGIAPVSFLIQDIVGTVDLTVTNIIPSNADPHNFQLTGKDALLIAKSDLVIAIDTHIDAYLLDVTSKENNHIKLLNNYEQQHHDHDHNHSHEINSHLWLSYIHAEDLAVRVLSILSEKYPEYQKEFTKNTKEFIIRLQKSQQMLTHKQTNIYVIQRHHAWDYLLEELNITLLGTLEEHEGKVASLKKINNLTEVLNKLSPSSKVIFIDDEIVAPSATLKKIQNQSTGELLYFNPMVTSTGDSDIINILEYYSKQLLK